MFRFKEVMLFITCRNKSLSSLGIRVENKSLKAWLKLNYLLWYSIYYPEQKNVSHSLKDDINIMLNKIMFEFRLINKFSLLGLSDIGKYLIKILQVWVGNDVLFI